MDATDRSLGLRLAVAAVLAVVVLVPFALLWALVAGSWAPLHALDAGVTDALHRFAVGHPGWVDAMAVWSYAFDPNVWRLGALVLIVWLVRRLATPVALWVALTMAVGGAAGALLKLLAGRDRPDLLEPVAHATGYSFPSGHALNSALGAGVFLLVLLPLTRERPGRRRVLWAFAVVVPLVTGICRIGARRALDQRCSGGLAARRRSGRRHRGGLRGVAPALRRPAGRGGRGGRGAGDRFPGIAPCRSV